MMDKAQKQSDPTGMKYATAGTIHNWLNTVLVLTYREEGDWDEWTRPKYIRGSLVIETLPHCDVSTNSGRQECDISECDAV